MNRLKTIIVSLVLMLIGLLLRAVFGFGHWGMGYRV